MAYRKFSDEHGQVWEVWEILPTALERRRASAAHSGPERRHRHEKRLVVPERLQGGWLAFQSSQERRRLVPATAGWSAMTDEELRQLLRQTSAVGKARRLVE